MNNVLVPGPEKMNPVTYKVDMPECNQEGSSFELRLKLFFEGILHKDKCLEVHFPRTSHKPPMLTDFVFKNETPQSVFDELL